MFFLSADRPTSSWVVNNPSSGVYAGAKAMRKRLPPSSLMLLQKGMQKNVYAS